MPKQSQGCVIRHYEESDVPAIAEIEFDVDTKCFVGVPEGTKEQWIKKVSLDLLTGWVVVAFPENEVAGRVCLNQTPGAIEFEIIISKKFWGRRLGREVASLMIPAAFDELNAKVIQAEVHPNNKASLALLDSFGFEYKYKATKKPMLIYGLERSS
jgi:RimJ/RimL family protein N-acetyltransferase